MGSISTKAFHEILEEEHSPETPTRPRRTLVDDPRSPSTLITRTPIQVEKTPESILDPRSPTVGIARTPIYGRTVTKGEALAQAAETPVPTIPMDDLNVQNQDCSTESHGDEARATVQSEGHQPTEEDKSSPGNVEQKATPCIDKLSTGVAEGDLIVAAASAPPKAKEPVDSSEKFVIKRRKPKKLSQDQPNVTSDQRSCKVKATSCTRSPLRSSVGDSQRSPLALRNMDYDSPRIIVQQKLKLGVSKGQRGSAPHLGSRSPSKYQQLKEGNDKENAS